jgi:hypothetical protein
MKMIMRSRTNSKLEVVVGAPLIVILGLVLIIAVLVFVIQEHPNPAKMFPLLNPDLWQAVYYG